MTDPAAPSPQDPKPSESAADTGLPMETRSTASAPKQTPWIWGGAALIGAVAIALAVSLGSLFREETPLAPAPETPPSGDTASTDRPASLEDHQKLVSEVVQSLGRDVLIGDSPTLGNPDAPVVLLEFSDFQCPYCAQAAPQMETFVTDNSDDVLLVFKHLPLSKIHPEALPAAFAAWAAGQQGKFWEFHDALFSQQAAMGEALYLATATDLGLNIEQFNRDRASDEAKAAIARDLALASEFQLSGTPSFIMNEILIPGAVPLEFFNEALARLKANPSTPAAPQ